MLETCLTPGQRQSENIPAPNRLPGAWGFPEKRAWLSTREISETLRVTRRHVIRLIEEGSFECVIDLKAPGADQAFWRVARFAFTRFGQRARGETCGRLQLDAELNHALAVYPNTLTSLELAAHFHCSKQHIYHLATELANVGTMDAERSLLRVSRVEVVAWIKRRMV